MILPAPSLARPVSPEHGRFPTYLIFGAPGSGKGTQGRALGSVPGFFHCACGDVFRALDTSTELGRAFLEHSSKGQLVPDELTIALWNRQITINLERRAFQPQTDFLILDGIPRNVAQARLMDQFIEVKRVFYLECPNRAKLVQRLQKRALRDNRLDDASDRIIHRRLEVYEEESAPLLQFYQPERIARIDSTRPPVTVLKSILDEIVSAKGPNLL